MRKLVVVDDECIYLMASGETKLAVWHYSTLTGTWTQVTAENSRKSSNFGVQIRTDKFDFI